jgi:hypothetical protein
MQASSSAREILDARGRVEAISEGKAGLTLRTAGGRRRTTRDTQTAALAPLGVPAPRWCCAMPSLRRPPRRRDAAFAASSSEASSAAPRHWLKRGVWRCAAGPRPAARHRRDAAAPRLGSNARRSPRNAAAPSERKRERRPNNATLTLNKHRSSSRPSRARPSRSTSSRATRSTT